MRRVQVSIGIEIFNDETEKSFNGYEPISIYADSNNVWEALWAGVDEVLTVLKENGRTLPSFGRKEHKPTAKIKEQKLIRYKIARRMEQARVTEKSSVKKDSLFFVKDTIKVLQNEGWVKFAWEVFSKIPLSECEKYVDIVKTLMPIDSNLYCALKTNFDKGLSDAKRGVRYDYLCRLIGAIASVGETGYYQDEKNTEGSSE